MTNIVSKFSAQAPAKYPADVRVAPTIRQTLAPNSLTILDATGPEGREWGGYLVIKLIDTAFVFNLLWPGWT